MQRQPVNTYSTRAPNSQRGGVPVSALNQCLPQTNNTPEKFLVQATVVGRQSLLRWMTVLRARVLLACMSNAPTREYNTQVNMYMYANARACFVLVRMAQGVRLDGRVTPGRESLCCTLNLRKDDNARASFNPLGKYGFKCDESSEYCTCTRQ